MYPARILVPALLALSACATTPNDVAPGQQALDQRSLENRQAVLNGQIGEPQSFNGPQQGLPVDAGAQGDVTFLDPNGIEGIAAGAIAEAEAAGAGTGQGAFDNIQPQQAGDVLPPPLIPRVAAFALRTTHLPGEQQWRRNPFRRGNPEDCLQYASRDLAQDAFLREGGPERDPLRLDPDGDGFVCGFDPRPLRAEAAAPATEPTFSTPEVSVLSGG